MSPVSIDTRNDERIVDALGRERETAICFLSSKREYVGKQLDG